MNKEIPIDHPFVKTWVGTETIIDSYWSEKHWNLQVITVDDDGYCLYRFFYLGTNIHCSRDINSQSAIDFIKILFSMANGE